MNIILKFKLAVILLFAAVALVVTALFGWRYVFPLDWWRVSEGMERSEVEALLGEPDVDMQSLKGFCIWGDSEVRLFVYMNECGVVESVYRE
ncbi:hypothetical protein Rhal01_02068 [Rubritalea halochordaticola]|uniref:Lipoprotein SmpA/OmlA domain-containing protein n=2 Tax=Rubritalea halochordaticola TaxID=714537 RepID=A0ABP9V3I2_9BACT